MVGRHYLEDQDFVRVILGEAVGDSATGRAGADDDVIVGPGHLRSFYCNLFSMTVKNGRPAMGDKNPLASSGKTLRVTESRTLPPMAWTSPGRTSTTISQCPGPRSRFSRVVPPPAREAQIRSP